MNKKKEKLNNRISNKNIILILSMIIFIVLSIFAIFILMNKNQIIKLIDLGDTNFFAASYQNIISNIETDEEISDMAKQAQDTIVSANSGARAINDETTLLAEVVDNEIIYFEGIGYYSIAIAGNNNAKVSTRIDRNDYELIVDYPDNWDTIQNNIPDDIVSRINNISGSYLEFDGTLIKAWLSVVYNSAIDNDTQKDILIIKPDGSYEIYEFDFSLNNNQEIDINDTGWYYISILDSNNQPQVAWAITTLYENENLPMKYMKIIQPITDDGTLLSLSKNATSSVEIYSNNEFNLKSEFEVFGVIAGGGINAWSNDTSFNYTNGKVEDKLEAILEDGTYQQLYEDTYNGEKIFEGRTNQDFANGTYDTIRSHDIKGGELDIFGEVLGKDYFGNKNLIGLRVTKEGTDTIVPTLIGLAQEVYSPKITITSTMEDGTPEVIEEGENMHIIVTVENVLENDETNKIAYNSTIISNLDECLSNVENIVVKCNGEVVDLEVVYDEENGRVIIENIDEFYPNDIITLEYDVTVNSNINYKEFEDSKLSLNIDAYITYYPIDMELLTPEEQEKYKKLYVETKTNSVIVAGINVDYIVEYYYNGELDEEKTYTVESISGEIIETYEDKVKPGYKLDRAEVPFTVTEIEENNIIRVYYVADEIQTKELSYTVEYYKDGVKVDSDTQVEKETVQVLEPDTLNVDKDAINVTDKYVGYKLDKIEPNTIPDTIENGGVIKVYYVRDTFGYTVEYYFDNVKDDTLTDTFSALSGEVISTYIDKVKVGYRLETVNTPITITENVANNVIKVYYVVDETQTKELSYTVEYYKDGVKVDSDTQIENETVQVLASDTLNVDKDAINVTDKYVGYKLDKIEPNTIPDTIENGGVIKVYYVRDTFGYSVEYYFEGVIDNTLTDNFKALYNEQITTYAEKVKVGYRLETVNTPITITENAANNVIRVYYVVDETQTKELSYTVEYYKDGVKVDSDTQIENKTVQVLASDTLNVDKTAINVTNKYVGYKLDKVEPNTIPDTIENGGVIKVYYVRDTFGYSVEYYFEGVKDETLTETFTALYNDEITTYTDKVKVGYKLHIVETIPMKVTENAANNVIRVYYVIDENQTKDLSYTVEYYKDGVKVDSDTQIENETVQILDDDILNVDKSKINLVDKYYGYKLDIENTIIPDSVTTGSVIKVYYVINDGNTKNLSYTVEYYKDNILVPTDTDTKTVTVQVLEPDTLNVDKTAINMTDKYVGYKFDKVEPTNIPDTVTDGTVIKVYYVRDTFEYSMEYYFDGVKDDSLTGTYTALYNEKINDHVDKVKVGYTLERVDPLPLTVTEDATNNVMRIYYVTDELQTKELTYTVEYYKDGVKVDNDTQVEKTTVQVLEPDTMTVNKDLINTTNKYFGYKVDVENTIVPNSVKTGDVIKVYYIIDETQTKELSYTVEYYKDNVLVSSDTQIETVTVQVLESDTMTVNKDLINIINKYYGYKLDAENTVVPDEVTSGDVIKVYYVTDELDTKTLFYTVEYYKDNVLADRDIKQENVQVLEPDILNVDKDTINMTDKYVGYKFDKVEPNTIPDTISNGGVIKVYYIRDTFGYSVEYYFEGVKDETLTDTFTALYNDEITTYTDKVKVGYKLHVVETIPMKVTENSANNVIRVYYVIDENQTKDLSYTVEYYKDNVLVQEDTQTEKTTVQILDDDILNVDKSKINLVDKYYGYKLDAENTIIPDSVTTGSVIKVYYVINDGNTKNLSYTVEYYKDNVLVSSDTDTKTVTVQVLEPDTLNVDKDAINVTDKYVGYKFEKIEPTNIPDTVTDGTVIKVYYVRDTFSYSMEYYFNGVIDDSLTDTYTALYNEKINDHVDKVKVGYTLERVDPLPLTVTEDSANNVMRIYYVTDELQTKELTYTVEYYKDGEIVSSDTQVEKTTVQVLQPDIMTVDKLKINVVDKYVGYKLEKIEPETIPDTISNGGIIKVYYVRDTFGYSMEYYYDGIKDDSLTDSYNALYNEKINDHVDKVKVGYTLDKVEPLPLTVTENAVNNVMRIYYITDELQTKDLSYTVEYYKDGILVPTDTQVETENVQVLQPDTMTVDKTKINLVDKYFGYKLDTTTVVPDIVNTGDVIKVYYVVDESQTKELSYTVEYYKDGAKVDSDTQVETTTVQVLDDDILDVDKTKINVTDKYVGYKLDIENTVVPDSVTTGSVIKVYYVRDTFGYTVEYYFDNVKDDSLTGTFSALYGDVIDTYENKVKNGYRLNKVETLPMTITEKLSNNVIRVYYVTDDAQTKDLSYTVEYYKDGVKVDSDTQIETETVQLLEDDKLAVRKDNINMTNKYVGYKFEKVEPETIPDEVDTGAVIRVYYVRDTFGYTVEYYFDNVKDDILTDTFNALYGDVISTYTDKVKVGYKLDTVNVSFTITEVEENNIIRVYYVTDDAQTKDLSYTVEYYKDGVKVDSDTQIETETVQLLEDDKLAVRKDNINMTNKYVGYKFEKVEPENIPDEIDNGSVIRVYYVRDTFGYTVEYYFDNVKDDILTDIFSALYGDVISTYTDKVKVGYKLDTVNVSFTITEVEENNIIRVYYVTDDAQTKELSYTVEYYKDGVLAESEVEKETVQLLEDNIMNVDLSKINIVNKYVGYKLSALDPVTLPSEVESGAVIKVYYVRESYNYVVEYYYNEVIDSNATERINAKYNDEITTYEDKVKPGYKLDRAEVPFIVTEVEANNVIRVYYVTDDAQTKELSYTVEYYKDGILADTEVEKETVQLLEQDILNVNISNINMTNKYVGYKFEKVEPETIPNTISNGSVIKVYYVRDTFGYTVEYYYNNVIDDTLTENKTALYGDTIDTFTNNVKDGYIQGKVENIPLVITEDEIQNIIRVFYEIDPTQVKELSYTVEYYKDGIKVDTDTQVVFETVQLLDDDIMDVDISNINITDKYVGYKLDGTDPAIIPTEVITGTVIKVYYVKDNFDYIVEYYYENVIDPDKSEVISATYQDVIDTYTDKVITGYEFDKVEGTPLTITENESTNVIKVYYKKARFEYKVEYYYDGELKENYTETKEAVFEDRIETYTPKEDYGYKFEKTFNLPMRVTENIENNVIEIYYVRKDSTVSVQFVDKLSGDKISDDVIKEGKVFDTFDITNDVKEIPGYTLIESPSTLTGTFEEETQTFVYYYAKTSEVKVKYLEESTNVELSAEETIVGYESKNYSTVKKDIPNYTFVKDTENTSGVMTDKTITVIYYYAQNTKVTVNYIDKNTGAILDQVVVPGKVGDEYTSAAKDITYYVLVESPVRETVTMTKDEIVLEYYYAHVSAGVIEKHIDIKSGELLDNKEYVGNEGDTYTTNSKSFDGYDLVVESLPENASGIMTIDVIEVKYYYIRRTMVMVEYVDNLTGDVLKDYEGVDIDGDGLIDSIEEIDSTEIIEGHEGDNYTTKEKSFNGYDIVKEKYPTNSTGTMGVVVDEDGKTSVITKVTYYYALKTKVTVNYIDVMTGEVIETVVIDGHEGEEYETERKEIDKYDIVTDKLPENEKGTMIEEPIEVNYYYRAKASVTVNHIDNYTGKELLEIDSDTKAEVDSSVVIEGHEGDEYKTSSKSFKGYELREDKLPTNAKGYMSKGDTVVNYYYSYKSSVKVLYIEKATGKNITDSVLIEGYEGDNYKATSKDVTGYKLIEVPGEESGKITKEQKTLVYYYIRLSGGVKVNHIDASNGNVLGTETLTGNVGDEYNTSAKGFDGYNLVQERLPNNSKGTMTANLIEVNYYYSKVKSDSTPVITPPTGDSIMNGLIVVAYTVLGINVMTLIKKKRNAKK